jgi:hypothetical protein
VLVRLDRRGTVVRVLVVREHGCRLVRVLHQHSGPGGRPKEVLGVVVVGEGRPLHEAGTVFEGVQLALPNMDSRCLLVGRTRVSHTVAPVKRTSPDTLAGSAVEQTAKLGEAVVREPYLPRLADPSLFEMVGEASRCVRVRALVAEVEWVVEEVLVLEAEIAVTINQLKFTALNHIVNVDHSRKKEYEVLHDGTHIFIPWTTVDSSHNRRRVGMFELRLRRLIAVLLVVS